MQISRTFLLLLALAATASAQQPAEAPPLQCPAFAACSGLGCFDPSYVPSEATPAQTLDFHGWHIPNATTNSPLVNAGLFFLHQTGSEQFLLDALNVVCRKADPSVIDCDSPLMSGRLRGADGQDSPKVFDLWTSFLVAPLEPAASAPQDPRQAACREYAKIAKNLGQALLPAGIALQSSPYSTEGIVLRLTLSRALTQRHALESRCQAPPAPGVTKPSPGQCAALGQFFDDLRFAHLLTDKLSFDNRPVNALRLLRQIRQVVEHLEAAVASATTDSFNTLLGVDWENLRAAIQIALSN